MARGATTTRHVRFATDGAPVSPATPVISIRGPREDEYSVMIYFARHADRCDICADPYSAYKRGVPLCDQGYNLARDVAKYIYAKGGKPFSVIDRQRGDRFQVTVPAECEVINSLVKAFDRGMTVNNPPKRPKPILVNHDSERREKVERVERAERSPTYVYTTKPYVHEEPRRERERPYRGVNVVEIVPNSSRRDRKDRSYRTEERYRSERKERPVSYYESRGSLYERDEEERSRLRRYQEQPIVIVADPRRRETRR